MNAGGWRADWLSLYGRTFPLTLFSTKKFFCLGYLTLNLFVNGFVIQPKLVHTFSYHQCQWFKKSDLNMISSVFVQQVDNFKLY